MVQCSYTRLQSWFCFWFEKNWFKKIVLSREVYMFSSVLLLLWIIVVVVVVSVVLLVSDLHVCIR